MARKKKIETEENIKEVVVEETTKKAEKKSKNSEKKYKTVFAN